VTGVRVDLVRRGFEAWNSGDRQWVLDHMRPDVEWITPSEDPEPGRYHGFAELEEFWSRWRETFGHLHFEVEDTIDAGDSVVVIARRSGEHSGVAISDRIVQVFSFDADDRCFRVQEFYDRGIALNAAEHVGEGAGLG
jgi:ketosteroid isomerase-like protein